MSSGPTISFDVCKVDGSGKRKPRQLVCSKSSVTCQKRGSTTWSVPAENFHSIKQHTPKDGGGGARFTVAVLTKYEFEAEDSTALSRIMEACKTLGLGIMMPATAQPLVVTSPLPSPQSAPHLAHGRMVVGGGGSASAAGSPQTSPAQLLSTGAALASPAPLPQARVSGLLNAHYKTLAANNTAANAAAGSPSSTTAALATAAEQTIDFNGPAPDSLNAPRQQSSATAKATPSPPITPGTQSTNPTHPVTSATSLNDFQIIRLIGEGSFGRVLQAVHKATKQTYAIKVLNKTAAASNEELKNECEILSVVNHPFLIRLYHSFEDAEHMYIVMEYVGAGELFYHLKQKGRFTERQTAFLMAEIVCGLCYLHERDIIYRDLKPENLLLTLDGHVKIADFGLAKAGITSVAGSDDTGVKAQTFCGTPQYLAPEILKGHDHGHAVDWWSAGVLMYELLEGRVPFNASNRSAMYQQMLRADISFPVSVSKEAQSFIRGVLVRNPTDRLGCGMLGATEITAHPFFRGIVWNELLSGRIEPPFIPTPPPVTGVTSPNNRDSSGSNGGPTTALISEDTKLESTRHNDLTVHITGNDGGGGGVSGLADSFTSPLVSPSAAPSPFAITASPPPSKPVDAPLSNPALSAAGKRWNDHKLPAAIPLSSVINVTAAPTATLPTTAASQASQQSAAKSGTAASGTITISPPTAPRPMMPPPRPPRPAKYVPQPILEEPSLVATDLLKPSPKASPTIPTKHLSLASPTAASLSAPNTPATAGSTAATQTTAATTPSAAPAASASVTSQPSFTFQPFSAPRTRPGKGGVASFNDDEAGSKLDALLRGAEAHRTKRTNAKSNDIGGGGLADD